MIDSLKSLTSPATRLDAIILTLSIQLIAALLTSFMLIWHVSTVHLLWNHSMPEDWKEEFKRQEFGGKRGALWGVVLAFVSLPNFVIEKAVRRRTGCLIVRRYRLIVCTHC